MGQMSKEMRNMLTEFLICEIGSKALDGITYALITKDPKDKDTLDRYNRIREVITECGFERNEIFRVYEVDNGYIFDMDLGVAKGITAKLAKSVEATNGAKIGDVDLIGDSPEKRRKGDMLALAKYIKREYENGRDVVDVALFSRNSTQRIVLTGKDAKGNVIQEIFNAYAIRHWDIENINAKLLIPAGLRISKIEPFEILPSKTGVKFSIYIEACR